MRTDLFDYNLPPNRIAQSPLSPREQAKLLLVDRTTGAYQDRHIFDLPDLLETGDLLIFNDSKVFKARLEATHTTKLGTKTHEVFLLNPEGDYWSALVRGTRTIQPQGKLLFADGTYVTLVHKGDDGVALLDFHRPAAEVFRLCETFGHVPTPPYVKTEVTDEKTYQTVYAKEVGSVAAPTAGFHFTEELLELLRTKGIQQDFVTLHVGLGTFRPMQSDDLETHKMHSEWAHVSAETIAKIEATKAAGHRVIAVGTTATRALESAAKNGRLQPFEGSTDIFITPGSPFNAIDGLLTNFHLPKSTLLVLVSALAGREQILAAYQHAIESDYRFYSFGDAMLII